MLGWLPSMYRDFGASPAVAGFLLSLSGLVQIPVSLVLPALADRAAHQVGYAVGGTALIGAGLAGVLLAPMAAPYLWVGLIGAGQGACFALGLNLFVLRTRAGHRHRPGLGDGAEHRLHALRRSARCSSGSCTTSTGSWTAPLVLLLALLVPQVVSGALAGRAPHGAGVTARTAQLADRTAQLAGQAVRRRGRPGRAVSSRGSSSGACSRAHGDRTLSGAVAAARNASQSHHTHSATSSGAGAGSPSSRQT